MRWPHRAPREAVYRSLDDLWAASGQIFMLALVAVFLAVFRDYSQYLAPGQRGTILIIAADRKQSRVALRHIGALLKNIPMLARMIERETAEGFDLSNKVTIEVGTASYQSFHIGKGRWKVKRLAFKEPSGREQPEHVYNEIFDSEHEAEIFIRQTLVGVSH